MRRSRIVARRDETLPSPKMRAWWSSLVTPERRIQALTKAAKAPTQLSAHPMRNAQAIKSAIEAAAVRALAAVQTVSGCALQIVAAGFAVNLISKAVRVATHKGAPQTESVVRALFAI